MYYYDLLDIQHEIRKQGLKCNRTDLIAKAQQYHEAVTQEIVYGFMMHATVPQILNNTVPFNISRVRKNLGRYGKPQRYWWDWLHTNFPLVTVLQKGNSIQKMNSLVESTVPLDILLASQDSKYVIDQVYRDITPDTEMHFAPIDQLNLKNYILATASSNHTNPKIVNNLKMARLIQMIADANEGHLPQMVNLSTFGRTYYKGPNLQSVAKTVRHAALGPCYEVDVNSSVFNWKYSVVPFQSELVYTRELIRDKVRVRRQLARLLFDNEDDRSINTVKTVLTAIGFGARGNTGLARWQDGSGVWKENAIKKIIRSDAVRERFFKDTWVKRFMAEQKRMDDHIFAEMQEGIKEAGLDPKVLGITTDTGRISRGKTIAFGYQQSEATVMKNILEVARVEPILQVHDAFYFKTKPDVPSMGWRLQQHWPIATLSIEEIAPWNYENVVDIEAHRAHIAHEEAAANQ